MHFVVEHNFTTIQAQITKDTMQANNILVSTHFELSRLSEELPVVDTLPGQ